jgi:hypothetical protein
MAKKTKILDDKLIESVNATHKVWHKFYNWLVKTYGKDLHGKQEVIKIKAADGKVHKFKTRSFNDLELSRRLVGYDVMVKIERYVSRYCPEIKIVHCDDDHHAGSDLLLIPHIKHGISIIFIPQCTDTQNRFFLYESHCKELMKELKAMSYVYKKR